MGTIMHDGVLYSGGGGSDLETVELTTAEYNALTSAQKHDLTKIYFLTDADGSGYTLPIASANELGGIKVGSGLSIDNAGILSSMGFTLEKIPFESDVADFYTEQNRELKIYSTMTLDTIYSKYSVLVFNHMGVSAEANGYSFVIKLDDEMPQSNTVLYASGDFFKYNVISFYIDSVSYDLYYITRRLNVKLYLINYNDIKKLRFDGMCIPYTSTTYYAKDSSSSSRNLPLQFTKAGTVSDLASGDRLTFECYGVCK